MVDIGTLRGIENLRLVRARGLLEESLSYALVDDDECDMGKCISLRFRVILVSEDLLELIKLVLDDLFSH